MSHEDPVARMLDRLREHGARVQRSATGYLAQCPAHPDNRPSLKVDAGDRGVALNCYAGCRVEDILSELKLEWKDLFYEDDERDEEQPEATYEYRDEDGVLLYQVVRLPGKKFLQRKPGQFSESWSYKLGDVRRVPYRLPHLLQSPANEQIYIVEGEKDADAVIAAGGTATCAAGGAGKSSFRKEWLPFFLGRDVTIVADKDEPGRDYALRIYEGLNPLARSCRIVESAHGKDAYDHLQGRGTLNSFVQTVPQMDELALKIHTWEEFREHQQVNTDMLVEGLWSAGALGFIAGAPKARKTWLGLGMALAIASGKKFLGTYEVPQAQDVLYLALEGSQPSLRARLACLMRGYEVDPDGPLDKLHMLYRPNNMNLMLKENAERVRRACNDTNSKIVFIDVLRAATVFDENSASDFSKLMANLRPILNDGISISILHHFSKWGDTNASREPGDRMVGSGAMRGALDVGLYLTNVSGSTKVESEARDLTMPEPFKFSLAGFGTGANGGFTYRDTCVLQLHTDGDYLDKKAANSENISNWIRNNGGSATPRIVCSVFGITDRALQAMADELVKHGIFPQGRGVNAKLVAVNQMDLA